MLTAPIIKINKVFISNTALTFRIFLAGLFAHKLQLALQADGFIFLVEFSINIFFKGTAGMEKSFLPLIGL
jgi:hypothetical protein